MQQMHSPVDDVQRQEQLIRDEQHVAAASAASTVRAEWLLVGETQQQQFDIVDSQVIGVVTQLRTLAQVSVVFVEGVAKTSLRHLQQHGVRCQR